MKIINLSEWITLHPLRVAANTQPLIKRDRESTEISTGQSAGPGNGTIPISIPYQHKSRLKGSEESGTNRILIRSLTLIMNL